MEKQSVYFLALIVGTLIGWWLLRRNGHYQDPIANSRRAYMANHPIEAAMGGFFIAMGLFGLADLLVGLNSAATLGPVPYSLVAGFSMLLHALSLRHGRTTRQQKKSD